MFLFRALLCFQLFTVPLPASANYHPLVEYDRRVLASLRDVHYHSCAPGLPILRSRTHVRQRDREICGALGAHRIRQHCSIPGSLWMVVQHIFSRWQHARLESSALLCFGLFDSQTNVASIVVKVQSLYQLVLLLICTHPFVLPESCR